MTSRTHVPFDVFAMQIDVPVSAFVRDGELGWSCGQCPLDHSGQVISPGDLVSQTKIVCNMIDGVLKRAGFGNDSVSKLIIYYVPSAPDEDQAALALLSQHFSHGPVIVPVPVPHFYYDGMMIEVDVFTGPHVNPLKSYVEKNIDLQWIDGGDLVWALIRANLNNNTSLAERFTDISAVLEQQSLRPETRLSDHWFIPDHYREATSVNKLISNPDAIIKLGRRPKSELIGVLTFCREVVQSNSKTNSDNGVTLATRRGGPLFWVCGTCVDPTTDLVEQTRRIMFEINQALIDDGMTFENVTKITAHYVGGASAEDLHGNMTVRHGYYGMPGPASTGLPVFDLEGSDSLIAIDVIAVS